MLVVRRRLIFWLIKAYIKKSKKILIISFLSGLLVFFGILFGSKYINTLFKIHRFPVTGIVGSYEKENLPNLVVSKLSRGLTKIEKDGSIKPDLADKYFISNDGLTYTFKLKQNIKFSDGSSLESTALPYNFSDVAIQRPDKSTIIFKLKSSYSPFLVTLSRPVFKKGLIGVGDYYLKNIELNGNFVQTITLGLRSNPLETTKFVFYPTEQSLKIAFALGEVTKASGLRSYDFKKTSFDKFARTKVVKNTDYTHLVTLFYNVADETLSDKKLRLGLNYALPENFENTKKAHSPFPINSIYYNSDITERHTDLDHAKLLLSDQSPKLTITTLKKYKDTASKISDSWAKIGIKTKIVEVDTVPDKFQIFLSDFNVPLDPDQYVLWHSDQISNITKYKNLRIDKLLEDGRKTVDIQERKKTYNDFQKYLLDDMPASFLYFPYSYEVIRN